jgi:hypothetical protein
LTVNGHEPSALLNVANKELSSLPLLDKPLSAEHFAEIAGKIGALAESALAEDPLNARALRILGQVADDTNDEGRADKLMELAARHSLGESIASAWIIQKSLEARNYPRALYHADVLLRTHPEMSTYMVPLLAQLAETKEARGDLIKMLRTNPPWRSYFLYILPTRVTDARTPLDLLLSLRDSANPPTNWELRPYLMMLIGYKLYDLAYYTWLQFLPPAELASAGFLFNGNFMVTPSGLPFDWVITQAPGVTIDMVRMPEQGRGRSLFIDFQHGRVDYRSVTQMILLAPGTYQFNGKYKGALIGPRGLKWRIACADESATQLGESQMIIGKADGWQDINFSFTVPPGSCRPQNVRLDLDARMASEQLISGSVWFENLQIARSGQ